MTEITETLGPDEKIEFCVNTSRLTQPFYYVAAFIIFLFVLLTRMWFALIIMAGLVAYGEIMVSQKKYYFTNQRIIQENGLFSKRWVHVPYGKITDVEVDKDFLGRILDIGTIEIDTGGTEKFEEAIESVRNPEMIEKFIQARISENISMRR